MTCGEAKELFSPYLDGVLTGRQMQKLSGHVEHCGVCAKQYEQLRRTQSWLAWLMFNRKTSLPFWISWRNISVFSVAGPSVQMILVLRID